MEPKARGENPEGAEASRLHWNGLGGLNRLTEPIIGAAMEVHRPLGPGLLESAYEECLCYELNERGIRFEIANNFVESTVSLDASAPSASNADEQDAPESLLSPLHFSPRLRVSAGEGRPR